MLIKEHVSKSEQGSLKVHSLQNHLNACLAPAPLTHSADGLLRFGDQVMFYSVQTEGLCALPFFCSLLSFFSPFTPHPPALCGWLQACYRWTHLT
jgi:hypothetical protein